MATIHNFGYFYKTALSWANARSSPASGVTTSEDYDEVWTSAYYYATAPDRYEIYRGWVLVLDDSGEDVDIYLADGPGRTAVGYRGYPPSVYNKWQIDIVEFTPNNYPPTTSDYNQFGSAIDSLSGPAEATYGPFKITIPKERFAEGYAYIGLQSHYYDYLNSEPALNYKETLVGCPSLTGGSSSTITINDMSVALKATESIKTTMSGLTLK